MASTTESEEGRGRRSADQDGDDNSSHVRDVLALSLGVALGTAYYWAYFSDLLPLWEFREWVTWPVSWDYAQELLVNLVTREKPGFARNVAMLYVRTVGDHCGPDVRCLNFWMLLPASAAAALLYVLARQLRFARSYAIAAVLIWWFSAPVADAFAWQATINDRMALLFVLASLCLSFRIIDSPVSLRACAIGNVLVLLPVILAYNSKESAWFLGPSIVLAVLILRTGGLRRRLEGLLLFAMPLGYAVFNNFRYFLVGLPNEAYWGSHVLGETATDTLPFLISGLFGLPDPSFPWIALVTLVFVSTLVLHGRTRSKLRAAAFDASAGLIPLLWCAATLAVSLAIPLRVKFHALYYLYLPEAFFALSIVGLVRFLFVAFEAPRRAPLATASLVGTLALALLLRFHLVPSAEPRRMAGAYSQNFDQALEFIATRFEAEQLGAVHFAGHPSNERAYYFFEGHSRRALFRHHLAEDELARIPDGPIGRLTWPQCRGDSARRPEGSLPICVRLSEDMQIESARQGDREYWYSNE